MSEDEQRGIQSSREDVWFLKDISFRGERRKIVTQNYNGPCSFIAICNILILRGDIEVLPAERTSVSYELLSQLVGEYLLRIAPDTDLSAVLSIMPLTQKGMDLNPLFTGVTSFRPAGDGNGALSLFSKANIMLCHGWLVDPDSQEYPVLSKTEDYDNSLNVIVAADAVSGGQFVVNEDHPESGPVAGGSSSSAPGARLSDEDRKKIEDAMVIRHFLDTTSSQLTYYGLFTLASTLQPGALVALFRNSHLSVLHKTEGEESALYSLVTDYVFLNESSVVWERIEDVDGQLSSFVDSEFRRASPAGGDFAGHTGESALAALEYESGLYPEVNPADQALARQLQDEEDAHAQQVLAERERERERERAERARQQQVQKAYDEKKAKKKDKKCVIM